MSERPEIGGGQSATARFHRHGFTEPASTPGVPRGEYPRSFRRTRWECLNGTWAFQWDPQDTGEETGIRDRQLTGSIVVPFPPEAPLSNGPLVPELESRRAVWYRRQVTVPRDWQGRVLLHFDAVDDDATIWVNGVEAGRHRGGYTDFTVDLSKLAQPVGPGDAFTLDVRARDHLEARHPKGKQATHGVNLGCKYDTVTGMWRAGVWMEPVPEHHLDRPWLEPDVARGIFWMEQRITGDRHGAFRSGMQVRVTLRDDRGVVTIQTVPAGSLTRLQVTVPRGRRRVWSPADPHLYTVDVKLLDADGQVVDHIRMEAGLRSISCEGRLVMLNGEPVKLALVLDQRLNLLGGPTAPTLAALEQDIVTAKTLGFNGARVHQTVADGRLLDFADRHGFLIIAEFPDWSAERDGANHSDEFKPGITYAAQWQRAIERARSHPSVIGWAPFNEQDQPQTGRISLLEDALAANLPITESSGGQRLILVNSGGPHYVFPANPMVVFDIHCYERNPAAVLEVIRRVQEQMPPGGQGRPMIVSEVGGVGFEPQTALLSTPGGGSWSYGETAETPADFYAAMAGVLGAACQPPISGFCWTQLYDVGSEKNGLLTAGGGGGEFKFPPDIIAGFVQNAFAPGVTVAPRGTATHTPGTSAPGSLTPAVQPVVVPVLP